MALLDAAGQSVGDLGPERGYLAALTLRAAGLCAEVPRPASYYCHFLASPEFDEVELAVEVLKRGRRSESLEVRMTQRGGRSSSRWSGPPRRHRATSTRNRRCPRRRHPLPREAFERTRDGVPIFPFWGNVSCRRPDQGAAGEGRAAIREWVRFEPSPSFADPFLDAARPLILLDTFGWPAAYQRYGGRDYVAPNLDTAVWFHQAPSPSEWLLVDHENPVAGDGLLGVGGRVGPRPAACSPAAARSSTASRFLLARLEANRYRKGVQPDATSRTRRSLEQAEPAVGEDARGAAASQRVPHGRSCRDGLQALARPVRRPARQPRTGPQAERAGDPAGCGHRRMRLRAGPARADRDRRRRLAGAGRGPRRRPSRRGGVRAGGGARAPASSARRSRAAGRTLRWWPRSKRPSRRARWSSYCSSSLTTTGWRSLLNMTGVEPRPARRDVGPRRGRPADL